MRRTLARRDRDAIGRVAIPGRDEGIVGGRPPRLVWPPGLALTMCGRFNTLAWMRHKNVNTVTPCCRQHPLDRLGPWVRRQTQQSPMHRYQDVATDQTVGLHGEFGAEVRVRPNRVVLACFNEGDVERPETLADLREVLVEPGVA